MSVEVTVELEVYVVLRVKLTAEFATADELRVAVTPSVRTKTSELIERHLRFGSDHYSNDMSVGWATEDSDIQLDKTPAQIDVGYVSLPLT